MTSSAVTRLLIPSRASHCDGSIHASGPFLLPTHRRPGASILLIHLCLVFMPPIRVSIGLMYTTREVAFMRENPYIRWTLGNKVTMAQTRILVADDEEPLRRLLHEQLGASGYLIDEAEDGEAAIAQLQKEQYHIALLDINMPRKTGIDVLKYIREQKLPTKVIMLTGRLGFSVGSESMLLGADEYITKPFDLDYLELSIKRLLA